MRKICICLLALLLLVPSIAMAQLVVVDNGSDPSSRLNMRMAPERDAAIVGKFVSGTQVEVIADAGSGWSQVRIGSGQNSVSGYMMTSYLKPSSKVDAREKRQVASPYGTQSVVLRDRPSNSYDAVMMLMVGDAVTVIGVNGDFCFVQTSDLSVGCLLGSELK
ncbi:MAG: SH3 domain-containing protein [Clostridiales bacterium]|nr:SH3 domain-containing protein [Clostridiales bacterium]